MSRVRRMRKALLELPMPKSAVTRRYFQYRAGNWRTLASSFIFAATTAERGSLTSITITSASRPGISAR